MTNAAAGIDWRCVASQILRALRDRRSQAAMSRRLGYRSNVACDWEAGRRLPTAVETLRAARRLGIDVAHAFESFQPACAAALGGPRPYRVHAWLRELAGSLSIAELCLRSGHSRFAIARWLAGKTQPRLHDFLALVEAISGRASDLVAALLAIEKIPELYAIHRQRESAKRLAFDEPWSAAVLRALESQRYRAAARHVPGSIAARLDLSVQCEREILARLVEAGLVRFEADRYEVDHALTVDTQASPEDVRALKSHWSEVALARTHEPRAADWLAFNVVSTSAKDLERIRDVLRHAFREIRAIAAASEPAESVALLNLQLVTWDDEEPSQEARASEQNSKQGRDL